MNTLLANSPTGASAQASPSAKDVHDMVWEFIRGKAEASGNDVWEVYREVLLSAELQDLIRSGMMAVAGGGDAGKKQQKKKKRKLDEAVATAPAAAADVVLWTVCCCDGTTFSIELSDHAQVADAKRAIGVLRDVSRFAMELFVKDREEPLEDEERLRSAENVPLFMLPKPASDRLALEALFKSCGGAGWKLKKGWMTDAELGEWEGVTVDAKGRVIEVYLYWNNLTGTLPSEIQQLSALQSLYLDGNKLTGPIPVELGQLGALTGLNLNHNQLSGPVPTELGQLAELKYLHLRTNQLSGPIPVELRQLRALTSLSLHGNQLSGQQALRLHLREHNPACHFLPDPY
jgi:hypothetical protein